jgi:hypothetical protein
MTKSRHVSLVLLVTATQGSLSCSGQTTSGGGTGGTPPVTVTAGTRAVDGNGGAGPWDAGADASAPPPLEPLYPVAVNLDASIGCASTTVEPVSVAAPCTYPLAVPDGALVNPNQVNVIYVAGDQSTYVVAMNDSATCNSGWHFINDQTEFEICGSTCDIISADPGAQLVLMFACKGPTIT